MSIPTWSAGAHSVNALTAGGWFSFSVPQGVVGVAIGLTAADTGVNPNETTHGLRFGAGLVLVYESGVPRTLSATYTTDTVFHIVRYGALVFYCRGTTPVKHPDVPFDLPGTLIYASQVPLSARPQFLDAALLGGGDSVLNASLNDAGNGSGGNPGNPGVPESPGTGWIGGGGGGWQQIRPNQFRPLVVAAAQEAINGSALRMRPMLVGAGPGVGVRMQMRPMVVGAAESDINHGAATFRPMTSESLGVPADVVGVFAIMPSLQAISSGPGESTDTAFLNMKPLGMFASESEFAQAVVRFPPMVAVGLGSEGAAGFAMAFSLPAITSPTIVPLEPVDVDDTFYVSEEIESTALANITDTFFVGSDLLPSRIAAAWTVTDGLRASERMYPGVFLELESVAVLSDEAMPGSTVMVTDVVLVSDLATPSAVAPTLMVTDALVFSDAAAPILFQAIEDVIIASDEAAPGVLVMVEDVVIVVDEVGDVGASSMAEMVTDTILVSDAHEIQAHAVAMVEDVVIFEDSPLLRGDGMLAWVLNTETSGVAWYEHWAFTGMVQLGDKVLAIGPDGLAVLGADSDAGKEIDADVVLGYTDFGGYSQSGRPKNDSFLKKHVTAIYVGYRADGVLDATVQTHGNRTYTYKLERQPARTPRNSRFKPGKGLNERFWSLSLGNVCGCAFEINSLAADVVPSKSRRI